MEKTAALVRDLARLFVKYDLNDWRPIIDALRGATAEYQPLATAITEFCAQPRPARRTQSKANAKKRSDADDLLAELKQSDPRRAEVLKSLYNRLALKQIAPTVAELEELCTQIGIPDRLPRRREDVVVAVLRYLASLSDDVFLSTLAQIPEKYRNLQDEYRRWFHIMYSVE